MRSLIDILDFSTDELDELIASANDIIANPEKYAEKCKGKPTAIIAKTTKGKGVSYMENAVEWHGAAPKEEQYKIAIKELTERA
jgi:transketolase